MTNVLVTGGAGYIGSHTVLQLIESGHRVTVLDNLYSGHKWAIPEAAHFYLGSISDQELLNQIFSQHNISAVIHFAGHIVVPESVSNPIKYYENNVVGSLRLIESCITHGIKHVIFSSSAAVYGNCDQNPILETASLDPISPYGHTKLITEWTLSDVANANQDTFSFVALRYFNVAGAHLENQLGQATPEATHLIKIACEAATGKRSSMSIFGDDYDTPDGTCIRDYIHVEDLARAHLDALDYLQDGGDSCFS